MLYHLLYPLKQDFILFNLFKYITFRTFCALVTSMMFYFLFGKKWILFLKSKQFRQTIRSDGPATHQVKKDTPTMGGVLVVASLLVGSLLWCDLANVFVWVSLSVMLLFALIGFIDDYKKVIQKNALGFRGQYKIVLEVFICLVAALFLYGKGYVDTRVHLPFFKEIKPDIGVMYLFLSILVIAGAANAVNLTDGLDGLVTVPAIIAFFSYGIFYFID